MSLCPQAMQRLFDCCNAVTQCQALYTSATLADFTRRLSAIGSYQSLLIGGDAISNLMGMMLNGSCAGDCQNASTMLRLLDPCERGTVFSTTSMTCQQFGQQAPLFNDTGSLFFTAMFLFIAVIILVVMCNFLCQFSPKRSR